MSHRDLTKQDAVALREQDLAMLKIIQDRLGITQ